MSFSRVGVRFQAAADQALRLFRLSLVAEQQAISKLRTGIATPTQIDGFLERLHGPVMMV